MHLPGMESRDEQLERMWADLRPGVRQGDAHHIGFIENIKASIAYFNAEEERIRRFLQVWDQGPMARMYAANLETARELSEQERSAIERLKERVERFEP